MCWKHHEGNEFVRFNAFRFMKEHALGLYETLHQMDGVSKSESEKMGYDLAVRFYKTDDFHEYIRQYYDGDFWIKK